MCSQTYIGPWCIIKSKNRNYGTKRLQLETHDNGKELDQQKNDRKYIVQQQQKTQHQHHNYSLASFRLCTTDLGEITALSIQVF